MHLRKWFPVALCASLSLLLKAEEPLQREIRIGVDQAAPYQSWREGNGPVGFSVDVLTEAARKCGIRLRWINCPEGPGQALQSGKVDLWPLLALEYAQRLGAYASEPWLQNEYAAVWRARGGLRDHVEPDLTGKTVSVLNMPKNREVAANHFPHSRFDFTLNRTIALQHMCTGRSAGAFMEVRILEPMLLERPAGCEGLSLGVRVVPGTNPMSLVARKPFRAEADALRAEIGVMFQDGRFGEVVDNWFVFSNIEAHSMVEVVEQRELTRYILAALGIMTVLMCLLLLAMKTTRQARRSAEKANRAKSTFLANVSHEVRTPMNGVLGMCDLLLCTPLTAQQKEYAATIGESARLQLGILNDLLDSAKIEAGKLTLEAIAFSPTDLMQDIERTFHGDVLKKGLTFSVELAGVPAAVTGDPLRVRQIINNLVSNAVKFTKKGGIRIKVEGLGDGLMKGLLISVSDSGIGIPAETQAKLFVKFVQVDESTTRRFGGTGLGLSICKDLAELMGGTIAVESAEGHGTTFRVRLPLAAAQMPIAKEGSEAGETGLQAALPILVVEDNLVNQKVASGMLHTFGLTCRIANNGAEAVTMCATSDFAAILMDCQMPGMDGFEATRRIRASGLRLPIVALTAGAADQERRRAFDAGMDDFLSKPVSRAGLRTVLNRWLTEAGQNKENELKTRPVVSTQ